MLLFLIFLVIYIAIYVIKYKFYDYNKNFYAFKNLMINATIILVTLTSTFLTIHNETKLHCGVVNSSWNMYMPFVFIMITYLIFTNIFSGVLIKPFSNTFGYIFSFFIKLSDTFKKLLKGSISNEKLNNMLNIVMNKPNICINEFTPFNISRQFLDFKDIIRENLFNNNNLNFQDLDLIKFIDGVKQKWLFSELLFLLSFLAISNLWTKNEILNTKCRSNKSIGSNINNTLSKASGKLKSVNTKKPIVYNTA